VRFIIRAQIPAEAGNRMVKDPNFLNDIEKHISNIKAEATYFFEAGGDRVMVFVADIPSADMIPAIAEPLFQKYSAKVEFHPVMVLDDLKKAIAKFGNK